MSSYWDPSNLKGLTIDAVLEIKAAHDAATASYGEDPSTRDQAAAHEAGHVVVARVLGDVIDGVRIYSRKYYGRTVWLGCNKRNRHLPEEVAFARERPGKAFLAAMHNYAGMAGEMLAGLFHPASSIDEAVRAEALCDTADAVWNQPIGTSRMRAKWIVGMILINYRRQFDVIRNHLSQNRRLTRADVSRMLKGVTPQHLSALGVVNG